METEQKREEVWLLWNAERVREGVNQGVNLPVNFMGKRRKLVNFGKKSGWFTFTEKVTGKLTAKSHKNQRLQVYVNYVNQLYIE